MKMAISVESAGVHSVLRDSIANSSSSTQQENSENIANKIIAIAKKILLTKIEYEEVNNYDQSVLDTFKSKYTVLKPFNSGKLITSQGENIGNSGFEKNGSQNCSVSNYQHQNNLKTSNELPQAKRILFPRDSVQVGWRSSGRKWQIGSGMMNVGNTCYLNSTLQALFHVPAMANWLISDSEHREECRGENSMQDGCIICAMAKTLICSQVSSSAIRPQLVYSRLKQICKHLIFGRQEDAHEFLRYLVEAMEKSYLQRFKNFKELDQYSKETTPLNQILGGYLKTSVRCLSCGHVSTTFQHFQDLLLDIRKPNTIEEALDGYFAKERLEDMGYKCESCKKKVSAIKQFTLERAPISLCIQLKRFSMVGTKINKYIAIRPRLDLTKYATNKSGNECLSYKLVAMVTHLGASQHCGHYTAIGLTDQGGYYQFDDSCVRPISLPNVLNTNAYIIFYELDENQQSKPVCTQVSGENEIFKNDFVKSNENAIQNQQKNSDNCNVINENVNQSMNSLFSPKIISKLEFSQDIDDEKVLKSNLSNNTHFIGPQLPQEIKKEGNENKSKNNSPVYNDSKSTSTHQQFENIASSSKMSTNASKLLIHFKSSTTNINGNLNTVDNDKHNSGNLKKKESNLLNSFDDNCKFQKSVETNFCRTSTENTSKKEHDESVTPSTLPSMPKLDSNYDNTRTSISPSSSNNISKSPNKQGLSWMGPLSPNYTIKQNSQNSIGNKNSSVHNGVKNSPVKSLVPYGCDADEDSNNSSEDEISGDYKTSKADIKDGKNVNDVHFSKLNGETKKCDFSTSNETSPDASPEVKRIKSNPPSPHVVKTKAGLWQVTPITPNGSPKAETEVQEENNKKTFSNPFNTNGAPIPTSMFYSDKSCNNSGIYMKKEEKNPTVKELTKYSHRGYGANVLSWNGTKSEMEMVVSEEARQERKRQIYDDEENDIDRGRQKKIKNNVCNRQNDSNPGYNPFQEQQIQKNSDHNRPNWITGNNNRNSSKLNNTARYHYQNNFNNSHSFDICSINNDNINCNISFNNKMNNVKSKYDNDNINNANDGNNNNNDSHNNYDNDDNNINNKNNINGSRDINDNNNNNSKNNNNNNNSNKFSNKFNIINKTNNSINDINNRNIHINKNINNNNKSINKTNNSNCFFRNEIISPNYNSNKNNIGTSKNIYNQHRPNFINRNHNGSSNFFRRHSSKRFNLNQRLLNHQKSGEWR